MHVNITGEPEAAHHEHRDRNKSVVLTKGTLLWKRIQRHHTPTNDALPSLTKTVTEALLSTGCCPFNDET